jgi:hypothetical protein
MRTQQLKTSPAISTALALIALCAAPGAALADGRPGDGSADRHACEAGLAAAGDAALLAPATVDACHKAYLAAHTPRDTRNKVAALLAEKARPDLDTIAIASLLADAAVKSAPDQPWGYLARHDLARRLGRADLLAASGHDLEAFAATEPVVRAALSDGTGRPAPWMWLLRVLVLLGLAGTAVHAVRHRRRDARGSGSDAKAAPPGSSSQPAAVLIVLVSLLVSSRAAAVPADMPTMKDGQMSPFKIDDANPTKAVEELAKSTKNPIQLGYLLQDLGARADEARKASDWARAARYYHALAVAAPTPYGPRMECLALEKAGDIAAAIPACRELLTRTGVVADDYVHFVDLVLKNPKPLPDLEPRELEGVIAHLEKAATMGNLPTVLRCKVAMRFEDRGGLERCEAAMKTAPAHDPTVISLKWGLAVRRSDRAGALALVDDAAKAGVSADNVARMRDGANAIAERRLHKAKVAGGLGVFFLIAAMLGVRLVGTQRRRAAGQSPV